MATRVKLTSNLRIVWAIATKDILDAIRNKTTISLIIGVSLIMLSAQAFPVLLGLSDDIRVVVVAARRDPLVQALQEQDGIRAIAVGSEEEMKSLVRERGNDRMIGLAPFSFADGAGSPLELEVHQVHWEVKPGGNAAAQQLEGTLSDITGRPVQFTIASVYPVSDTQGQLNMLSMGMIMGVFSMSAILVPLLMIEERETHTMDALQVSPATNVHIVAGKAIAGMVFGLAAAAVVLLFSRQMIVHWEVAVLAVVAGTAFSVAVGLLLGTLFENQGSLNLWLGVVFMVIMAPIFAGMLLNNGMPAYLEMILPYMPAVALDQVFRLSFVDSLPATVLWPNVGALALAALLVYMLTGWIMQRSARR